MNKYKILGIFNLLFSATQLIIGISQGVVVSKIQSLYSDFNVSQPSKIPSYVAIVLEISLGIANSFIAAKLLSKAPGQDRFFKSGFALILISVISFALVSGLVVLSTIFPIYNLTSQF